MKTIEMADATAPLAEYARVNPPGTGLTTEQVRRAISPRRARRTGR